MRSVKKFWRSTPAEYKDYLFIYLWGAIWASLMLISPRTIGDVAIWDVVGRIWALVALAGGVIAVVGLIRRDNLVLERLGVALLTVGPITYALTMLGVLVYQTVGGTGGNPSDSWRVLTVMVFALWPFLFLNKRRRHLKNRVRLVSKIPVRGEDDTK